VAYKLDISKIVKDHFKTLVNDGTGHADFRDWFFFLILPVLASATLLYFKVFIDKGYIDSIIAGLSIFVGLSLNLVVLLFEIAQKEKTSDLKKEFIRDVIANISFLILISILTIITALFTLLGCDAQSSDCILKYITNGLTYFLIAEVILVIILLVRNMYYQMIDQVK
jgi:hypothetical protein